MMEDIVRGIEPVMHREELMPYQALITVSVVMNILMHTVLDTRSVITLENSYKEGYTIGHDK
jgi:hypothetical protein